MPMTQRQLNEATADYEAFLDGDEIVAVEEAHPGWKSTCDLCGLKLHDGYYQYAAKQLVIVPLAWAQGSAAPRHYRLLVCRQGVHCRKRRLEQLQTLYAPSETELVSAV